MSDKEKTPGFIETIFSIFTKKRDVKMPGPCSFEIENAKSKEELEEIYKKYKK